MTQFIIKKADVQQYPYTLMWIAISALFAIHCLVYELWQGDSDPWMKLAAFEHFYQTGDWYNRLVPRINYPFGDYLEWSRPFDVLLAIGTQFLQLFVDHQKALLAWGAVISPACGIVTFHIFMKILKQQEVSRLYFLIATILFAGTAIGLDLFSLGRADHHGFLLAWYAFSILVSYYLFQTPTIKSSFWIGWVYGFGLWCSPETLPALGCVIVFFVCEWMITGQSHKSFQVFLLGTTVATLLFTLAEYPPSQFLTVRHDRLSIVHGTLIVLVFLMNWLTAFVKTQSVLERLIFLGVSGACILGIMQFLYPGFYHGPLAAYGTFPTHGFAKYYEHLNGVDELKHSSYLHVLLHSIIVVSLVYFTLKENKSRYYIFLTINCLVFAVLYFMACRYMYYYMPALFFVTYPAFQRLHNYMLNDGYQSTRAFIVNQKEIFVTIVTAVIITGLWLAWTRIPYHETNGSKKATSSPLINEAKNEHEHTLCHSGCDNAYLKKNQTTSLLEYIKNEQFKFMKEPVTVMVPALYGPGVILFTKHRAVGGFYTHNFGIVDTDRFFDTHEISVIKDIILRRQVKIVAFEYTEISHEDGAIMHAWANDQFPSWVEKISSPKTTQGPFVFVVNRDKLSYD